MSNHLVLVLMYEGVCLEMESGTDRLVAQWESNARAFAQLIDRQGTPHHRQILNPCVEKLLGSVQGKKLLDAGCGEGYLSRYYAQRGAEVLGVDVSAKLIEICRTEAKHENLRVEYRRGDICTLDFIRDKEYDIVLCNLVLLNVPNLDNAMKELTRVLKRGGHLVFSVVHPAFDFYGLGHWEMGEKDPNTGRRRGLYFKVDNYFDEREYEVSWKTKEGKDFPQPISFFHRTMTRYCQAVISAGLVLDRLEEPLPVTDDEFFERERRIPFFLVIRATKP